MLTYQSDGIPTGYLECDGQLLDRSTYAALFNVIGTKYGNTSSSNFRVPDLRGEFIRGYDHGRGIDSGRGINDPQGASNASHNHTFSDSGTTSTKSLTGNVRKISETFAGNGTTSGVFSKLSNQDASLTPGGPDTSPTGGFSMDVSHNHTFSDSFNTSYHPTSSSAESRPRNIAMMYIIKF